jgi:membrane-associated phospholipid phosphatase
MVDISEQLQEGAAALQVVDEAIAEATLPIQHNKAVQLLGTLSEIGDQPQVRTLSAGLIGAGLFTRNPRLARTGVRMLAAHELATAVKSFVKRRVDRTRPRSLGQGEAPRIRPGDSHEKEETSFPSGHSAGAAAAARAFQREYPEQATAAYVGAGLVALAQIPRCAHYPTDVGAGLAVGVVSESVSNWLLAKLPGFDR